MMTFLVLIPCIVGGMLVFWRAAAILVRDYRAHAWADSFWEGHTSWETATAELNGARGSAGEA